MYIYMYMYVFVYMYLYMYVCVCMCLCVCVCVCVHAYMFVNTSGHSKIQSYLPSISRNNFLQNYMYKIPAEDNIPNTRSDKKWLTFVNDIILCMCQFHEWEEYYFFVRKLFIYRINFWIHEFYFILLYLNLIFQK